MGVRFRASRADPFQEADFLGPELVSSVCILFRPFRATGPLRAVFKLRRSCPSRGPPLAGSATLPPDNHGKLLQFIMVWAIHQAGVSSRIVSRLLSEGVVAYEYTDPA